MGVKSIPVGDFDEQEISLASINIRPDLLQVRADISREVVHAYAERRRKRSPFPPVHLTRLPDGSLWLDDGFHRVEAAKKLRLRSIPAIIKDGTMESALLDGIEENFGEYHTGRHIREDDKEHAAMLMIRNETFRAWSDHEISRRCRMGPILVRKLRLRLRDSEGIPIPEKVMIFRDGKPTGTWRRSTKSSRWNGIRPSISRSVRGNKVQVGGQSVYLPKDDEEANRCLDQLMEKDQNRRKVLASTTYFEAWLKYRLISTERIHRGLLVQGGFLVPVDDPSTDAMHRAIGILVMAAKRGLPDGTRLILVGYFRGASRPAAAELRDAARLGHYPIETMTPDEVEAAFGPKED